jgi:hypothetical protein
MRLPRRWCAAAPAVGTPFAHQLRVARNNALGRIDKESEVSIMKRNDAAFLPFKSRLQSRRLVTVADRRRERAVKARA